MTFRDVLVAAVLFTPMALQAEIYKCVSDGNTVFSDQPCGKSQELITLDLLSTIEGMTEDKIEQAGKHTQKTLIKEKIRRAQEKIKSYRQKMEKEYADLKRKKLHSAEPMPGVIVEELESVSTEMIAVPSKYKVQIDLKKYEIEQLRDELKEL